MDEDLNWRLQRWRDADAAGRDDEADAECGAVFRAVPPPPAASSAFAARTVAAIAAATADDARRARRARRGFTAGSLAAAAVGLYVGGGWALSAASAAVVGLIDVLVNVTVRMAASVQAGADVWTVLASLGRATAAFMSEPAVTAAMFAIQGIAMAALVVLQRLLRSERESLE